MADAEEQQKRQLYNRQEYVVGAETQRKYGTTDILIAGLTGLGVEIAKNLMLTGVRSITILDDTPVSFADLSTNFYAAEKDVGQPRSKVVEGALAELNRYVVLKVANGPVTNDLIKANHVVIFVDHKTHLLTDFNTVARENGVKFVTAESRGIAGAIFVDAGPKFTVLDYNGEETVSCVVTNISPDGVVNCFDDKKHDCVPGDEIYFTNITEGGPVCLNSADPQKPVLFKVKNLIGPFMLEIELPEGMKDLPLLKGSCYLHTTKQPVQHEFKSLEESIANPEFAFIDDDAAKLTAPSALHVLFGEYHRAEQEVGRPLKVTDTDVHAKIVEAAIKKDDMIDKDFADLFVATAAGSFNPMACIIGGFASQEVLKCSSGKFTPVKQWFYYDVREVLSKHGLTSVEDRSPAGNRYDGTAAIFGKKFQEKLCEQTTFIVGAGALGCELIKNCALLGIGTGTANKPAKISMTDMDRIELGNLSRQFLFRRQHIGMPKSIVAAEAAKAINPNVNIDPKEEKVAHETEGIFNEKFWTGCNFIVAALDNVQARKYVDAQCVFNKRALFESGTQGTKCNTQPVIPFLTESYGSSYDAPEKTIALCTLKNFPNAIEHTIQWGRDAFEKYFVNEPSDCNNYLTAEDFMTQLNKDPGNKPAVFAGLVANLGERPKNAKDCVAWARVQFQMMFNNNIQQLMHNLPLDKVTETGELFWSGAKKPPKHLEFDASDKMHVDFIKAAANLRAVAYRIKFDISDAEVGAMAAEVSVPKFEPATVSFATSEKDKSQAADQTSTQITEDQLPDKKTCVPENFTLDVAEFEKDDDSNWHMDFITAVSNLRATNYGIPTEDKHRTKMIAGKIIPAMVTTTSLVTGLVGIEILKYVTGVEDLEQYKSAFVNIALPMMAMSNPISCNQSKDQKYSMWDRFDVDEGKELTLKELVDYMMKKHNIEVSMMSTPEGKMIYSSFGTKAERLAKPVSKVWEEIAKTTPQEGVSHFSFVVTPESDEEVPLLRYRFRWD